MSAEDFERWNENHNEWTGVMLAAAREAWLAAEARLLKPERRTTHRVVRDITMPSPPVVVMVIQTESQFCAAVKSIRWDIPRQTYICDFGEAPIIFASLDEALRYYGPQWRMFHEDEP